jgi:hypothetical protein
MLGRRARISAVAVLTSVAVLALGSVALAAVAPVLRSPRNGHRVHAGHVRLVVYDPAVGGSSLYVAIRRQRKLDRYGYLVHAPCNVAKGCDFITLRHWKGHPGYWTYVAGVSFPGYWATTPGRYYWQASIVAPLCAAPGCQLVSAIHSFRVHG